MRRSLLAAALTVAALTAIGLSGCSAAGGSNAASTGSGSNGTKLTIGFVAQHFDTYFTSVKDGLTAAAKKDGDTVIAVSYADDAGKEAQAYQNLISRGVNVVVTSPLDPKGSVTGIKNIVNAGIPVVCYNTCINDTDAAKYASAFIQSDNTALGTSTGTYAGEYIKKNLGGKATLALLNCPTTVAVCVQRRTGFLNELKKQGVQYTVEANQDSYLPDKTASDAQNILTAHPNINVIWAGSDGGGTGAISAVKSEGLTGKVHVFSTDISSALAQALVSNDNVLLATTGQDGAQQGSAILAAIKKAKVGKQLSPYETLIPGVLYSVSDQAKVQAWLKTQK